MEVFWTTVATALIQVITVVATIALTYVIAYINKWLTLKQKDLVEEFAMLAVLYVQQTMPHIDPEEKLLAAIDAFEIYALTYGIKIDKEAIIIAIEAALKQLKLQLGEEWEKEE